MRKRTRRQPIEGHAPCGLDNQPNNAPASCASARLAGAAMSSGTSCDADSLMRQRKPGGSNPSDQQVQTMLPNRPSTTVPLELMLSRGEFFSIGREWISTHTPSWGRAWDRLPTRHPLHDGQLSGRRPFPVSRQSLPIFPTGRLRRRSGSDGRPHMARSVSRHQAPFRGRSCARRS